MFLIKRKIMYVNNKKEINISFLVSAPQRNKLTLKRELPQKEDEARGFVLYSRQTLTHFKRLIAV